MNNTNSTTSNTHRWRFFSAGGFDQVRLDRGEDLARLGELDQKLWVALSCPVDGLEFDPVTLKLLDSDGDGHIRAADLIAACTWACERLADRDLLARGSASLPLAAIDASNEAGQRLLASARQLLAHLGRPEATEITAADSADSVRIFAATRFNGDGLITTASDDDPELQALIAEIGQCYGTRTDRSGAPGIGLEEVDAFFADAASYVAWLRAPHEAADLLPLGAATESACEALEAVREKVDDWFARCRLAAYDQRAAEAMNGSLDDFRALAVRNLARPGDDMAALPLARVEADAALPLEKGLNPAWAGALHRLHDDLVAPLLGARRELSADDWVALTSRLEAYCQWRQRRPQSPVMALDAARIEALVSTSAQSRLHALIAADAALADEADAIGAVDQLVRYTRDLARLADNFVAFRSFYSSEDKAIFQAGTLYLDGRSCDLCVPVLNAAKHAQLAGLSGVYLAYCDCVRGSEKRTIAAAFTAGDSDQLMVGRNGVFYDRQGRDWDATIVRLVDHPISLRQAFFAPYKKASRLIGEQFQKLAANRAKASDELMTSQVQDAGKKVEAGKAPAPAAPAAFDVARFAGIFAAIGLAVGALGTALAALLTGFLGLKWWQMPLAVVGVMLLISGPAVALAWFKLRHRNLAPILDANGWAVNARARINLPFGTSLTQLARLPDGAERARIDPFAERATPWWRILFGVVGVLVLLAWLVQRFFR